MSDGSADILIRQAIVRAMRRLNKDFLLGVDATIAGGSMFIENEPFTMNPTNNKLLGQINDLFTKTDSKFPAKEFQLSAIPSLHIRVGRKTGYEKKDYDTWKTDVFDKLLKQDAEQVVDVNMSNWVNDTDLVFMNQLYAWHDLCNDDKWGKFLNNEAVELRIASVEGPSTDLVNKKKVVRKDQESSFASLSELLDPREIAKMPNFNRFMFQRLLYVYIRMLQFHVAMDAVSKFDGLYKAISVDVGETQKNENLNKIRDSYLLPSIIITLLERDLAKLSEVISDISGGLTTRKSRYQDFSKTINDLSDHVDGNKITVRKNYDRVLSERSNEKKTRAFAAVGFVLFFTILTGSIAVYLLPLETRVKIAAAAGLLGLASLGALVMTFAFSKSVMEGFETSPYVNIDFSKSVSEYISLEYSKSIFSNEIRRIVAQYLENVGIMVHNIDSYHTIGNATYTMAKEIRYFADTNEQLMLTGEKMKGIHRGKDLHQKQQSALMHYFISAGIILAATLLLHVMSEKSGAMQTIILGVGGLILFLATVIFILEYSGYVRTDGDKKYWAQPSNTGNMVTY